MKMTMIVRFRLKTMADERLDRALIGPLGIQVDRIVHGRRR
jgi:hypothetical protein